jgi:hypothetical protein
MDSPDKMMQHLDASNKNAVFFGSTQRELLVEPKAALISPKQHSSTIAAPRGGRAGKKISGWLFVVHCWMKRPRKRFWANSGDVNLPQFVLQSCHICVKQSWS